MRKKFIAVGSVAGIFAIALWAWAASTDVFYPKGENAQGKTVKASTLYSDVIGGSAINLTEPSVPYVKPNGSLAEAPNFTFNDTDTRLRVGNVVHGAESAGDNDSVWASDNGTTITTGNDGTLILLPDGTGAVGVHRILLAHSATQNITDPSDQINPDGGSTIVLNPNANYTLTSEPTILAPTGDPTNTFGRRITLVLPNGNTNSITIKQHGGGVASNVFNGGFDLTITEGRGLEYQWDGARWIVIGKTEFGGITQVGAIRNNYQFQAINQTFVANAAVITNTDLSAQLAAFHFSGSSNPNLLLARSFGTENAPTVVVPPTTLANLVWLGYSGNASIGFALGASIEAVATDSPTTRTIMTDIHFNTFPTPNVIVPHVVAKVKADDDSFQVMTGNMANVPDYAKVGGVIHTKTNPTTATALITDVFLFTVESGVLSNDGDYLTFEMYGTGLNVGDAPDLELTFGGQTLLTANLFDVSDASDWSVSGTIMRTGETAQTYNATAQVKNFDPSVLNYRDVGTLTVDLGVGNQLVLAINGAATNGQICIGGWVKWWRGDVPIIE
jgi:hypothetical protein